MAMACFLGGNRYVSPEAYQRYREPIRIMSRASFTLSVKESGKQGESNEEKTRSLTGVHFPCHCCTYLGRVGNIGGEDFAFRLRLEADRCWCHDDVRDRVCLGGIEVFLQWQGSVLRKG